MLPKLNLLPRKAPYIVTASSPSRLSKESVGLDAKTLLVFQDLDGSAEDTLLDTYEIDETVAKLVIHDVSNLRISVKQGVVTTVEVHNARNLSLHLDSIPASVSADTPSSAVPGTSSLGTAAESTNYGTLSLDPSLHNVHVTYARPELVGAIVFASPLATIPDRTVTDVSLAVKSGETMRIADAQGIVKTLRSEEASDGGQFHIYYRDGAWQVKGLERKEKDYPALS